MTSDNKYRWERRKAKRKVFNEPDSFKIIAPNGNHAGACMSEERAKWLTDKFNERQHTEEKSDPVEA